MKLPTLTQQQKQYAIIAVAILGVAILGVAFGSFFQGKDKPAAPATQTPTTEQPNGTAPTTPGATEEKPTETTTKPSAPAATAGSITFSGTPRDNGIVFSWTLGKGVTSPYGFKLIRSADANVTYPGDDSVLISAAGARSYTWDIKHGETYYFKICTWNGGKNGKDTCVANSKVLKLTALVPKPVTQPYDLISGEMQISGRTEGDGIRLFWSERMTSDFQGYYLVRSETDPNPYYPKTAAVKVLSEKTTTQYLDTTAVQGKSYYYRVCSKHANLPVACGNVTKVLRQ